VPSHERFKGAFIVSSEKGAKQLTISQAAAVSAQRCLAQPAQQPAVLMGHPESSFRQASLPRIRIIVPAGRLIHTLFLTLGKSVSPGAWSRQASS
jgi:hypothetical protein